MANRKLDYKVDADIQQFLGKMAKSNAALETQIKKMQRSNREARKAKKTTIQFARGIDRLGKGIAQFAAGAGAIQLARQAILGFDIAAKKASDNFLFSVNGRKRLAQISTTAKELGDNLALAKSIGTSIGLPMARSTELVFQAKSAGFTEQEIRNVAPLQAITPDVTFAFTTVQQILTNFGKSAGTALEILNQTLAAARQSPLGIEEIATVSTRAAAAVGTLGGTAAELLAAVSIVARGGRAREQVTSLRAIIAELGNDPAFEGLGVQGAVEKLVNAFTKNGVLDTAALGQSFKGNKEAAKGAIQLAINFKELGEQIKVIIAAGKATGTTQSPIQQSIRASKLEPTNNAIRLFDIATARGEAVNELEAVRELSEKTIILGARRSLRQRLNRGEIGRAAFLSQGAQLSILDILNLDPLSVATEAAVIGSQGILGTKQDLERRDNLINEFAPIVANWDEASRRSEKAARALEDAAKNLETTSRPTVSSTPSEP